MLIDLHVHTRRYSRSCSILEPRQIAPRIRAAGLGGFCITEHDVAWSEVEIASLASEEAQQGLVILTGREVVGWVDGREAHVLAFGLSQRPPAGLAVADLAALIREAGAASVLAHPLRYGHGLAEPADKVLETWRLFDAVEVATPHQTSAENQAAQDLVKRFGLPATAGSDAHDLEPLGRWATRFESPVASLPDLVAALRAGRVSPWRKH